MKTVNTIFVIIFYSFLSIQIVPQERFVIPEKPALTSSEIQEKQIYARFPSDSIGECTRSTFSKSVTSNGYEFESIIYQSWNGSMWINALRYDYTYNAQSWMTENLARNWIGNSWVNYFRHTYTYSGNGLLLTETYQTWDGSAWLNNHRNSYVYNSGNQITEWLSENWNGTSWQNDFRIIYSYYGTGNMETETWQSWN